MFHLLAIWFSAAALLGCVEDESTTGDSYVENDNTYAPEVMRNLMNEHEQKVMDYFVSGSNPGTGMACNSSASKSTLTTGATGFGIMSLIIGVERGWITRSAAASQIVRITEFLKSADRFAGAWAHWYDPTGKIVPFGDQKAAGEIVETAFMMGGLLTASEYFDGADADETAIREATGYFWQTIEWNRFLKDGTLYWIWHADEDRHELPLVGWNETLLVYILGMAAPEEHRIPADVYRNCWQGYDFSHPTRETYGYSLPLGTDKGGPLFLSQYSFLGLDPREMQDSHCYYWAQNQNHTMINRHYCVYEAPAEYGYSESAWGLTACGGCGEHPDYRSRDPENDDGILAPTAAISAFPYTPFYSAQVLLNLERNYAKLNGRYGFYVSYCPSDKSVSGEYLAMEHAPMAIMMENYRSGLIWKLLMGNSCVQEGLRQAGITAPTNLEGFCTSVVNTATGVCDLLRHPDRGAYEIDLFMSEPGRGTLTLTSTNGSEAYRTEVTLAAGRNTLSFFDSGIVRGKRYRLTVTGSAGRSHVIDVVLR